MWVGMSQWTKQKTVGSLELMHIHINILCGPKNRSTVSGNETLRLDCSCSVIWDTWCLLVTSSVLSRSYRYITWGNTYVLLRSCQFIAPKFRKYNRQHLKDPFPSPPTSTLGDRLFIFFSFYAFMLLFLPLFLLRSKHGPTCSEYCIPEQDYQHYLFVWRVLMSAVRSLVPRDRLSVVQKCQDSSLHYVCPPLSSRPKPHRTLHTSTRDHTFVSHENQGGMIESFEVLSKLKSTHVANFLAKLC